MQTIGRRGGINLDAASISHDSDGATVFDDPTAIWTVRVWPRTAATGHRIDIHARPGQTITATALSRLPVAQMVRIAAVRGAHPNELLYQMLARERPVGARRWGDDHWSRVLTVYEWAQATGRPGGGRQAVADLWGVSRHPTVSRWLAHARRTVNTAT